MTTSPETVATDVGPDLPARVGALASSGRPRFVVAFVLGLVVALGIGVAAIYAYGASYAGRILPGVRIGDVDVAGLTRAEATARLADAYASFGTGSIVLTAPTGDLRFSYADIGRRPDVDAMVANALAVGRSGSPIERTVAEARTAFTGVVLDPRVTLDPDRLSARVTALVSPLQRPPANAAVAVSKTGFDLIEAKVGRSIDGAALAASLVAALGATDAASTVRVEVPVTPMPPAVDDAHAVEGMAAAEKMVADVTLAAGKDHWKVAASTVRSWLGFAVMPDGRYAPTIDGTKVDSAIKAIAKKANQTATNARFLVGKGSAIVGVTAGRDGRAVDVPVTTAEPSVDDAHAAEGKAAAERMVADVTLAAGKDSWKVSAATVRSWLGFAVLPDGRYAPTIDRAKVDSSIKTIAKKANQAATNATFLVGKGSAIVGVTGGRDGRAVDVTATTSLVAQALNARASGTPNAPVELAFTVTKPAFGTDEARKTAPLMKKISSWTTPFPITVNNGFGANIWLPAQFIDGTVVAPGATFDFWKAVGPVTRARGFKQGGAIIDGHTEPQGALAGGICSCSTTLFNAALRAGFEMHARKNHFYYIDRYPLGLDATVFISA
ncbi:MAG TPA: peptidoglycan binding domain-containing protein, partial [Candidatus Limnocylindrales bacterium]|nr:peptidoglycan binding domain-containing protein [Candidatus Limnocylindrales bacterium]